MRENLLDKKWTERYKKLNEKQREAVDTIDGPVLVVAGPGSGKTELLAIRTANILKQTDILPSSILLLTFTDTGSYNMRERLKDLIGEEAYRIGIYTFHAFATDLMNKNSELFFNGAKFKPASDVDQITILEEILSNLPRKNILSKKHPELGYIYLKDVLSSIRDLKKGNYTPESLKTKLLSNNKELKEICHVAESFQLVVGKRKYGEILPVYISAYEELKKEQAKNSLARVLISTLGLSIQLAEQEKSTKPLTIWKNSYLEMADSGKYIWKDARESNSEKLHSLLGIYSLYQEKLYENALYDFEDMILLVTNALKENQAFKADLQEKFQYIMLDEFQDTNDSQFNLVLELTKNSANNDNPNILAVGDDDQAIYKFQSAELNNIFSFVSNFPKTKVIVLDKNYRSTQEILHFSREVITKAKDRLEVRDKNITKVLKAENAELNKIGSGKIIEKSFDSETLEYTYISEEIQKLLKNGVNPKEIAVICRKHEQLKELSQVLNVSKIPYSYSKKENVLEKKHIQELTTIVKFLAKNQEGVGEDLLPTILSFDFWGVDRVEIWKVAENVKKGIEIEDSDTGKKIWTRKTWLEAMHASENAKIKEIANFLISLSVKSLSTPIEYILDEIIGTTEYLWEDSEHTDIFTPQVSPAKTFVSPYKNFYFNNKSFEHNKPEYLDFLFSLRTFISALREFHSNKVLYSKDLDEFLSIYNGNKLTLSAISPFASSKESVNLLTAHASKGLEFEYVFLLSADQEVWAKNSYNNRIQFPINMPLSPESDNSDDKIRLLYVALTRTKHTLYITHNKEKVEYLLNGNEDDRVEEVSKNLHQTKSINSYLEPAPKKDFVQDEKILLTRLLENYKMPVTHLNNFLNFTKVGPEKFIEQNLLRFPQAQSGSSVYGSAMHETIERYFLYYNKFGKASSKTDVFANFENILLRGRLGDVENRKYLDSGKENLEIYLKYLKDRKILPNTKVEVKFSHEEVVVEGAKLTGNIDKMEFLPRNEIIVTDLKTGEAYESFDTKGLQDYEKIKLHFYKYQLAFYAILVENSKTFHNYFIKVANLEFIEASPSEKIIVLPFLIDKETKDRVLKLASIVYSKILSLDFPDTSSYPQTLKGILAFENDLLAGYK
jgi:DNA helicase-2/ATP-dependent DNA helicase PcrA